MKLCKDCKWHHPNVEDFSSMPDAAIRWAKCYHPKFINPGNGLSSKDCADERRAIWIEFPKCGKSGKLFEPKTAVDK